MKTKLTLIATCLLVLAAGAAAQNRIKLFDPVSITVSDPNVMLNSNPYGSFRSVEVYLSCTNRSTSTLTGPDNGPLVVDNMLLVGNTNVCPGGSCFMTTFDPIQYVGMPVESSYRGVAPIDISRQTTSTGLYTFTLLDFGYTYGSSAVYLNTSCSITPVNTPDPDPDPETAGHSMICHRDNGNRERQTLLVGSSAVPAHLAHGDTLGACGQ